MVAVNHTRRGQMMKGDTTNFDFVFKLLITKKPVFNIYV